MLSSGDIDSAQKISNSYGNLPYTMEPSAQFGCSVAAIGDLNGDGIDDLAAGARGENGDTGAVIVLFMDTNGLVISAQKIDGSANVTLNSGSRFGASVAAIGDFNGDGTVDLAVGAYHDNDGAEHAGALYILFMHADGSVSSYQKNSNSDGSLPFTLNGPCESVGYAGLLETLCAVVAGPIADCRDVMGDEFGRSVAAVGDLNGDGVVDPAVGAPGYDPTHLMLGEALCAGNTNTGAVHILFMNAIGTVGSRALIAADAEVLDYPLGAETSFGQSVAAIGDIDGDGLFQLAVGQPKGDDGDLDGADCDIAGGCLDYGAMFLIALNMEGSVMKVQKFSNNYGDLPFTLQKDSRFGDSLAAAGDIDGDGLAELVVGARSADAVYVLNLRSICPSAAPTVFVPTPQPSALPSLHPTTSPTPVPSPVPTPAPTSNPTQVPSFAPTTTTEVIIAPRTVRVPTEKPNSGSDIVLIVNPNEDWMMGTIDKEQSPSSRNVSWSIDPTSFSLPPGGYAEVQVTVDSIGLRPKNYYLTALVTTETTRSLPVNTSFLVEVDITAKADANTTRVIVTGAPALGERWDGIKIEARDADSYRITSNAEDEAFVATLHPVSNEECDDVNATASPGWCDVSRNPVKCDSRWSNNAQAYTVGCTAPGSSQRAGQWSLEVSLDGTRFFSTNVHARCSVDDYENATTENCDKCPPGVICPIGTLVETMCVLAGHWRSGKKTRALCKRTSIVIF